MRDLKPLFLLVLLPLGVFAWDHPGHKMVSELALAALPSDYPSFVRHPANLARIGFLSGQPDRWSHSPDLPLKHVNWPDHFLDLELLADAGLDPRTVSSFRYDYAVAYALGRAAHPEKHAPIDPASNADHTREWQGFLPWAVTEYYGKLKAAFAALMVYQEAGTHEEIENAEADIVYLMGIMSHYVGDCAQPLHTTKHHDGWVGLNPQGYSPAGLKGFHTWIDSGLIRKAGIKTTDLVSRVLPAQTIQLTPRADARDPVFVAVMDFLILQNKRVEPLYILEKSGQLSRGPDEPVQPRGREFIETQLLAGGRMLAEIWLTAWRSAVPDTYLRWVLLRRKTEAAPANIAP